MRLFAEQSEKDSYKNCIKENYYLLTLTFDSKISMRVVDEYSQTILLNHCLDLLIEFHYFSCYEKHKSGILHAHVLLCGDYHDITKQLHKMKKHLTTSVKLEPSINIKPVKNTPNDIERAYNYIWDDKKDHPLYKKIVWKETI